MRSLVLGRQRTKPPIPSSLNAPTSSLLGGHSNDSAYLPFSLFCSHFPSLSLSRCRSGSPSPYSFPSLKCRAPLSLSLLPSLPSPPSLSPNLSSLPLLSLDSDIFPSLLLLPNLLISPLPMASLLRPPFGRRLRSPRRGSARLVLLPTSLRIGGGVIWRLGRVRCRRAPGRARSRGTWFRRCSSGHCSVFGTFSISTSISTTSRFVFVVCVLKFEIFRSKASDELT